MRRSTPNFLAGPYLDRVAHLRHDEARLRAALADPATLYVPMWRMRSLISRTEGGWAAHLLSDVQGAVRADPSQLILLGEFRSSLCFALELPAEEPPHLDTQGEFQDLRTIAGELAPDEAGILAYARAMLLWRERHRYCGRCGAANAATQAGHVMKCSNEQCGIQQFPRIDPAVIVLVIDGERALLGRQAAWPVGRYSTIAGFVEPGESLEDAVAREVQEETGVRVGAVEYHSSQPWPFPSSLMLGFTAHATSTQIVRTDEELEDVKWVSREQIAAGEVALPMTHSISFRLIEDWYDAGAARALRDEPGAKIWSSPRAR